MTSQPKPQHTVSADTLKPAGTLFYTGFSMYPTLRNLDILKISTFGKKELRRGDIIVFKTTDNSKMIVHRVISVTTDGVKTRGDNMMADDRLITLDCDIIGRVESINRKSKDTKIPGGSRGLVNHYLLRFKKGTRTTLFSILLPIIRIVFSRKRLKSILMPDRDLKTFVFQDSRGKTAHLYAGNRLIGYYSSQTQKWQIKSRYRGLIDENNLPSLDEADREEDNVIIRQREINQ